MVAVYGPIEEDFKERKRFWNDLDRVMDRVGNGSRCVCWEIWMDGLEIG